MAWQRHRQGVEENAPELGKGAELPTQNRPLWDVGPLLIETCENFFLVFCFFQIFAGTGK